LKEEKTKREKERREKIYQDELRRKNDELISRLLPDSEKEKKKM